MLGYHFTSDTLRDGSPIPPIGEWLTHEGEVIPCESGLHMSEHPFDALLYAPGLLLHLVELQGDLQSHGEPIDKWVGRRRKILATIDATELVREFACWCALQVTHLWDAPEVVRKYLETGDETLRTAAWAAASDAERDAARSMARFAAGVAKGAAKWAATGEAASDVLSDVLSDAAWAATGDALSDAAPDAAWAAARSAQRDRFAEMVESRFGEEE